MGPTSLEEYFLDQGSIVVLSGAGFQTRKVLVQSAGENNYYPSFSPDGKWILYNRAQSGDSYNNTAASLWVVPADGSAAPLQLAQAAQDMAASSWPRWTPFVQHNDHAGSGDLYYFTFSSTRSVGLDPSGRGAEQVWMSSFDPSRVVGGVGDPSSAPFWLPFQSLMTSNHLAQWTTKVVPVVQ
jgi:hypothetical protein